MGCVVPAGKEPEDHYSLRDNCGGPRPPCLGENPVRNDAIEGASDQV